MKNCCPIENDGSGDGNIDHTALLPVSGGSALLIRQTDVTDPADPGRSIPMRGSFQPNEIFDNTYQIVREIGHGGSGVVYLAYHLRLQKYVVVKRLNVRLSNEALMRTEADALKNLHHPYLPQVYDYIATADGVYTVMDYIEGTDLQNIPCGAASLPEATLMAWLQQLAEVLEYLHTRSVQIIHSDIKPANIILRPDGTVCLIDFNISVGDDIGSMLKGVSPIYASPEQVAMAQAFLQGFPTGERLDPRTDIYSLGATFYYLATGIAPDQNYQITPLSEMAGIGYSEPFCAIIDRCMAYDRGARYQTAAKLRSALANPIRQSRQYRRYVAILIAAVLLAGSLAAAGAYCVLRGVQGQAYDAYRSEYVAFQQMIEDRDADAIAAGQRIVSNSRYDSVFAAHKEERPGILRAMGDLKYNVAEYESASEYYGEALEEARASGLDPVGYYRDYVVSLANAGSLSKAERTLAEAESEGLNSGDLHMLRAWIAYLHDDVDTCLQEAQLTLEETTNDDIRSRACCAAGLSLYYSAGDLHQAMEWLERANAYDSRPNTLRVLAAGYSLLSEEASGQVESRAYDEKAMETYQRLYKMGWCAEDDLVNYGVTADRLGQSATAKRLLTECRETYGDSFPTLVALAALEYDAGNKATAKTLCDDAEQIYDGLQVDERENFSSYYRMLQRLLAALR